MPNVKRVNLLSERTFGVPPVIFFIVVVTVVFAVVVSVAIFVVVFHVLDSRHSDSTLFRLLTFRLFTFGLFTFRLPRRGVAFLRLF